MSPEPGQRVRVYRNLTRRCFSVQTKTESGWRVTSHVGSFWLTAAKFIVSLAGRARAQLHKQRNVHAFVEGDWMQPPTWPFSMGQQEITYNPFGSVAAFQEKPSGDPVAMRSCVNGYNGRVWATLA